MKLSYTEKPAQYTRASDGKVIDCINTSVRLDCDVILVNFDESKIQPSSSGELLAHTHERHSLWLHRKVEFRQFDLGMVQVGFEQDRVTPKMVPRQMVLVATCDEPKSDNDYVPLYDCDSTGKTIFNAESGCRKFERVPAMSAAEQMAAFRAVAKA